MLNVDTYRYLIYICNSSFDLSVHSCAPIAFQVSYYVQNLWQDTVDLNEGYLYNGAASAVYTILGKIYINNVVLFFDVYLYHL